MQKTTIHKIVSAFIVFCVVLAIIGLGAVATVAGHFIKKLW